MRWLIFVLLCCWVHVPVQAQGLKYALIAKSVDDDNFIDAWRGCQKIAELHGDECALLGPTGPASPRSQARAVRSAIEADQYDVLAISVTDSEFIAASVAGSKVPIITFDSPFASTEAQHALRYVGIDNVDYGIRLGELAKSFFPNGGTVCLMTAANDSNLAQRIAGVRQALAGQPKSYGSQRLQGINGWKEHPRCPWNNNDSLRQTLNQYALTIQQLKPDLFISVGSWPLIDSEKFDARVSSVPFNERKTISVMSIGKVTPAMHTFLQKEYIHALLSINFYQIGEESAKAMRSIALQQASSMEAIEIKKILKRDVTSNEQ
ncbi:substrate-binding domain-containing protein [bacterium]|nr:substrate-binding domain-containing protein [bacterium]